MRWASVILITLTGYLSSAEMAFMAPLPKQQLHVSKYDLISHTQPKQNSITTYDDEEIIVFALQAAVATFHLDTEQIDSYKKRLHKYYEPGIIPIVQMQTVDQICHSRPFSGITYAPAELKTSQQYWEVKLPMVLSDQSKLMLKYRIKKSQTHTNQLVISQFHIENHEQTNLSKNR